MGAINIDMIIFLCSGLTFVLMEQLRVDKPLPPACQDLESLNWGVAQIRLAVREATAIVSVAGCVLGLWGPFSSPSSPHWKRYLAAVIIAAAVFGIMVGFFWGDCAGEIFGRRPYFTIIRGQLQLRLQAPGCDPV